MRFAGTKRNVYTTDKVRKMRMERALVKPKKEGVPNDYIQHTLGKLQAAGHMKVNGFRSMNIEVKKVSDEIPVEMSGVIKEISINYQIFNQKGMDDKPHFSGYLRSASEVDKQYRLKGWFNEDGTIRLELVN